MSINFKETRSKLVFRLKSCIDRWCSKSGIHKSNLSEWKQDVLAFGDDKILGLSRQPRYNTLSILKEHYPNHNLKDLQGKYVIKPIDKATNDAVFIC